MPSNTTSGTADSFDDIPDHNKQFINKYSKMVLKDENESKRVWNQRHWCYGGIIYDRKYTNDGKYLNLMILHGHVPWNFYKSNSKKHVQYQMIFTM